MEADVGQSCPRRHLLWESKCTSFGRKGLTEWVQASLNEEPVLIPSSEGLWKELVRGLGPQ